MIKNFIEYKIFENADFSKIETTILFTDIVGSSELWKNDEKIMMKMIDEHYNIIYDYSNKHNGFIVKTIGDAFMIKFDDIVDSIKFSIDFQKENIKNPLKIKDKDLRIRIGFSSGKVYEKENKIQNKNLLDYFGNVVNTASRMESKVSENDGFAFSFFNKINIDEIEKYLNKNCNIEIINFTNSKDDFKNRSGRLLTDTHRYINKSIDELSGISDVIVYNCKLK
jgi:hypothetical protein